MIEIKHRVSGKVLWSGKTLIKADLSEADLRWADLRWADLREADLRGANLRGANLREADLREAKGIFIFNYGIKLKVIP